ncbi:MAG: MerR family transcriptional regulator [Gemmatimonadaceae bacterium]
MDTPRSSAPESARHPIAVVAARTGLSPDVLRVWERRYAAVTPTRAPDGQRHYSDDDVDRLRAMRAVADAGRAIGQVARLSTEELQRIMREDAAARAEAPATATDMRVEDAVTEALMHARAMDAAKVDAVLRRAAALLGTAVFLEQVTASLLRRIGEEWHAGRLTIPQEHLASSVVHALVLGVMRDVEPGGDAPRVVVATPAGERHAIGAALAGAAAAAQGWRVIFLGADLPAADIAACATDVDAHLVALSVVYVENRADVLAELRALRSLLPARIGMIAGGAGANALRVDLEKLGVVVGTGLAEFAGAPR